MPENLRLATLIFIDNTTDHLEGRPMMRRIKIGALTHWLTELPDY